MSARLQAAPAVLVAYVVATCGGACGGAAFDDAPPGEPNEAGNAGGASSSADAALGETSQLAVETGPCGPLRAGDAPTLDREICFSPVTFTMGSRNPNLGPSYADHTPEHTVLLSAFAIDAYEVTVGRYRACVAAGGCTAPLLSQLGGCTYTTDAADREDAPVTCVAWSEASGFCAWAGQTLPTEAEWEYAARGADDREYPWGNMFQCARAVLGGTLSGACPMYAGDVPERAGSLTEGASPEGVFDLAGNVAEWVLDWVGSFGAATVRDPQGPMSGASRVIRGGGWRNVPPSGLGYARSSAPPDSRGPWGFRCARSPR